ncbi:MAG: NADP-dependent oxidoreductase [Nakamurella sp.]
MMRAAGVLDPTGALGVFQRSEPRSLRSDEVLIDVRAAGVGNWDELMRQGLWPSGLTIPHALGVEAAGVVVATGSGVHRFGVGDAVLTHTFPFRDGGAWAEKVIAPTDQLAHKPDGISWPQAGCLPVPGLTAWQAVHEAGPIRARQRVFVHGAGGVTGGLLVQLAVLAGARVVATAGAESMARVREYGAEHVVDRRSTTWQQEVGDALSGGADLAINAVPHAAAGALSMVDDGGRFVSIAGPVSQGERGIAVRNLVVHADGAQLTRLTGLLAAGDLRLSVTSVRPLSEAGQALDAVAAGHGRGATTLAP